MAREVIATSLLIIASVIAVVALINAILPSISGLSHSYTTVAQDMENQVKTDVDIIFITTQDNNVSMWLKNVGYNQISLSSVKFSDIFISSSSNNWYPGYNSTSNPTWNYTMENGNGDIWDSGETIKITVGLDDLPSDTYRVKFILYNGVSATDIFSKG
ncbi:MAG: hypothetical protein ACOCPU_03730 [Methanohalophilus sp.]